MIKYLVTAFLAVFASIGSVHAADPPKRIFAGQYSGNSMMETATGDSIFYDPLRFKVGANGKITGTALRSVYHDVWHPKEQLFQVTGSITSTKTIHFGYTKVAVISGKISDGTTWKGQIQYTSAGGTKIKTIMLKSVRLKNRFGVFTGDGQLLN